VSVSLSQSLALDAINPLVSPGFDLCVNCNVLTAGKLRGRARLAVQSLRGMSASRHKCLTGHTTTVSGFCGPYARDHDRKPRGVALKFTK